MKAVIGVAIAALVSTAAAEPGPAGLDAAAETRCQAALEARGAVTAAQEPKCVRLAAEVIAELRDLTSLHGDNPNQPTITDTPGGQASAGQTAAIGSGRPVASEGGNVAVVGTNGQGLQLVTALAINPASIVTGDTSERTVWLSRFADVSIVLPMSFGASGATHGLPYVGGRLRINVVPALQSKEMENAVAGYKKLVITLSDLQPMIATLLSAATDPGKCAAAIVRRRGVDQTAACGTIVEIGPMTGDAPNARAALTAFREASDQKYLSIEGRFDHGDLTSTATGANDSLFAGYVSFGYASLPSRDGFSAGLRSRGGAVMFRDGMAKTSRIGGYAALGGELSLVRGLQRYSLSVAAELTRYGDSATMVPEDQKNHVRVGLSLPVADGKTVSVGVVIPTDGSDPTFAISGDWSLLLGQ